MSNHSSRRRMLLHYHQQTAKVERQQQRTMARFHFYYENSIRLYNLWYTRVTAITEIVSLSWYVMVLGIIIAGGWLVI